jgi:hypothetical protein
MSRWVLPRSNVRPFSKTIQRRIIMHHRCRIVRPIKSNYFPETSTRELISLAGKKRLKISVKTRDDEPDEDMRPSTTVAQQHCHISSLIISS